MIQKTLFFLLLWNVGFAELRVSVKSKAAVLVDADSGVVLYAKNKDQQAFPASITKIATAMYALELIEDLDQEVTCPPECLVRINPQIKEEHGFTHPPHWLETDGTTYQVRRFEKMPLYSLFMGMLLVSGNDASNVIAHHAGGGVLQFMEGLNNYLQELGCESTQFRNPHGLHHPEHYTTAHDMARIAQVALKNPRFVKMVQTLEHERPKTNKSQPRTIQQSNRMLRKSKKFYDARAMGMKTGYHKRAGYTLVTVGRHRGRRLIAVILGSPNSEQRYRDASALFDAAFAEKKQKRVLFNRDENAFRLDVENGANALIAALQQDVYWEYYPAEERELKSHLDWKEMHLPLKQGDEVGSLVVTDEEDRELIRAPIFATGDVDLSGWQKVKKSRGVKFALLGLVIAVLLVQRRKRIKG